MESEPVILFLIVAIIAAVMFRNDDDYQEKKQDFIQGNTTTDAKAYTESSFGSIVIMVFLVIIGLFLFVGMTGGN